MIVEPQIALYGLIAYLPLAWVAWGNNKLVGTSKWIFAVLSPLFSALGALIFVYALKRYWPSLHSELNQGYNTAFLVLPAILGWYLFKLVCEFLLPNKPHPYWGK